MKILGIVGSPRRNGNTYVLVNQIINGASEKKAQTELLFLKNLHINECDGCHLCWKGKECSKSDDMKHIYPKIISSDVIIFGTPVYWYGPTAIMKGLIDRFVYFNCPENRPKIKGKKAVLIVPFEEKIKETADGVVQFFKKSAAYLEINLIKTILVPGVTKLGEVKGLGKVMKKVYDYGRELAEESSIKLSSNSK